MIGEREVTMSYRKMTDGDIGSILQFLEDYNPEANVLRWQDVEEHSKFTRQALQAHPRIKEAYLSAKSRLAEVRSSKQSPTATLVMGAGFEEEIKELYRKIETLEHQRELWKRRWYCIAYHIRNAGVQMFDIDKPVPIGSPPMSEKDVRKILESFDQDIPPVASHREM